jgi:DNA-binding IclR family transcriptional regulator
MEVLMAVDNRNEIKNPVQSAERIFGVLETLAETGPIGLVDISTKLELHKSTVHRLLLSLICMGYVKQEENNGKYMLTFKIVGLSEKVLSRVDIVSMIHPLIAELANECEETVHFVQRSGAVVYYLDKVAPLHPRESAIRMASQVGVTRPLYCSAVGKAILSEMLSDEVEAIWANSVIEKKTEHTIINLQELKKELTVIREKGYAIDNEENELGVRCIAVCIRNRQGQPDNAFSISAPAVRMTPDRIEQLAEKILKAKESIQKVLGY